MTAKRVALIGFQVVLAILVGLAIRELWLSRSGDDATARRAPETLAVSARITPDVHTFGEPVTATVEVVADAGFIKPDSVRVETDFAPYELAGEPTVDREVINGVARVVFTYPLRCLREGCDAAAARGVAQLEPGFVRYRFVEGSGPGRHILDWPPFEVASRVSPAAVEQLRWRASDSVPRWTRRGAARDRRGSRRHRRLARSPPLADGARRRGRGGAGAPLAAGAGPRSRPRRLEQRRRLA